MEVNKTMQMLIYPECITVLTTDMLFSRLFYSIIKIFYNPRIVFPETTQILRHHTHAARVETEFNPLPLPVPICSISLQK